MSKFEANSTLEDELYQNQSPKLAATKSTVKAYAASSVDIPAATKSSGMEGKDSALGSSQFSIRPMQPKLDTITRTDDITKEKSIVPQTPLLPSANKEEQMTVERKDSVKKK